MVERYGLKIMKMKKVQHLSLAFHLINSERLILIYSRYQKAARFNRYNKRLSILYFKCIH